MPHVPIGVRGKEPIGDTKFDAGSKFKNLREIKGDGSVFSEFLSILAETNRLFTSIYAGALTRIFGDGVGSGLSASGSSWIG